MEKKPEYVTDALAMIGIDLSEPKKIVQEVSGFTPIFDVVADAHGNVTASVHGCAWRFCQMEDRVCKASLSTMGKLLGLDESTVSRHMKILVDNDYFVDLTPDLRNKPHVYADTGKVVMVSKMTARLADSKAGVAHSKATVAESRLNKELNKDNKKGTLLDGELHYNLKPAAIREAMAQHFKLTPNWQAKYNRQFMEWAVEQDVQPAQIEKAANLWRMDKRFNWAAPSLKGIQEHWIELTEEREHEKPLRML